MRLNSWLAFKFSLSIYLFGFWLSTLSIYKPLFITLNESSLNPTNFWLFLNNVNLLPWYLLVLAISSFGLLFPKICRYTSLFLILNLLLMYNFLPSFFSPPNIPFFGWVLAWFVFFPNQETLKKEDKLIWWFVLTLGYFCSGLGKIQSPLWASGQAFQVLGESSLTWIPSSWNIKIIGLFLTYFILFLEIFAIGLIWWPKGRRLLWFSFLAMHIGIVSIMNIPDVGLFFLILSLALYEPKTTSQQNI